MNKTAATSEFDRVCAALTQLSPDELEKVRTRAGFLAGDQGSKRSSVDDRDWLLRGIEDELRRRGIIGRGALPAERIAPGWKKTSAAARADLEHALGDPADPRRLAALGALAARTLADYLAGGGVPVTPRTMLVNAGKVLTALDAQFPGYAEAGLLGCCLDAGLVGKV